MFRVFLERRDGYTGSQSFEGMGVSSDGRNIKTWGRLGHLDGTQSEALDLLHERAPSEFPVDDPLLSLYNRHGKLVLPTGPTDTISANRARAMFLLRLLRARDFRTEAAEELLCSVMAWRSANRPWAIPHDIIHRRESSFHIYDTGHRDEAHRPVLYAVQRHMRRSVLDASAFQKAAVAFLERQSMGMAAGIRAVGALEDGSVSSTDHAGQQVQDQFVVLYDFGGFSAVRHVPLSALKGMFNVLQDAYPETLAAAYMLPNYPSSFYAVFAMVRGFIQPMTAAKIQFLSEEGLAENLEREVGREALPTWLGGANETFRIKDDDGADR